MKFRNRTLLLPFLLIPVSSHSIDEFTTEGMCIENQRTMNQCARDEFVFYEEIMTNLYDQQIHYLTEENKEFKERMDISNYNAEALEDAQDQWLKFRDADCLYWAGPSENSGSIRPFVYWSCMAERTKDRAIQLERYVGCRENGCHI